VLKLLTSTTARHIVFRLYGDEALPGGLLQVMREGAVSCGWMRASGVLAEVELRAYGADIGGPGAERRIAGPVQVLSLEGSVGLTDGDVSVGMRAVLARETDRGMETLAGEIVAARVVALEGMVTAFDDLGMARAIDPDAGVWLFGEGAVTETRRDTPPDLSRAAANPVAHLPNARAPRPGGGSGWSEAAASVPQPHSPPAAAPAGSKPIPAGPARYNLAQPPQPVVMPQRPRPPADDMPEGPFPEEGDVVEHFAFGTSDVIKADGERLHLRVHKDGRIKEIALEMLRVTLLTTDGETRRYRLDRRM
jgi:predicted DNA-binding protein with PD1-like motif